MLQVSQTLNNPCVKLQELRPRVLVSNVPFTEHQGCSVTNVLGAGTQKHVKSEPLFFLHQEARLQHYIKWSHAFCQQVTIRIANAVFNQFHCKDLFGAVKKMGVIL